MTRSEPNSAAWAKAKAKAFSLTGNSAAKRMVEGLLHPGLMVDMGELLSLIFCCKALDSTSKSKSGEQRMALPNIPAPGREGSGSSTQGWAPLRQRGG